MKTFIPIAVLAMALMFTGDASAREELKLFKESTFDSGPVDFDQRRGSCDGIFRVDNGKDVPDMREFRDYRCQGMYTLTLDGPAGTLVTLFGRFDFQKERGYLVIRKQDDKQVWMLDLGDFPAGQWTARDAKGNYGAFEVYYRPAPNFKRNISSIQWGQWWTGGSPSE